VSKELFDFIYKKKKEEFFPSESLCQFYETKGRLWVDQMESKDNLSILELGCGDGTLFEKKSLTESECHFFNITGIDSSFQAIKRAKDRWSKKKKNFPNLRVKFLLENILDEPKNKNFYDIILDSHLYHCLLGKKEQLKAIKNIRISLKKGGIFIMETMVSHKGMKFFRPFIFDKNTSLLFREDNRGNLCPMRTIFSTFENEKLLLENFFDIKYFMVSPYLRIIPDEIRREPFKCDPQCLRVICRKT
jgi:SAM-dependent methyltransferase